MKLLSLLLTLALCGSILSRPANAQDSKPGIFEGSADIGEVQHKGSLEVDEEKSTYTIAGGGENMWFEKDALHFVWKKVSGDYSIAAAIRFIGTEGNAHRKACLLFRQDLDPDSAYVDAAYHGDGLTSIQYRETKGDQTREVQSNISHPHRIQLDKSGELVSMSIANEDEELHPSGGSFRIKLADPFYIGIGVCAHDNERIEKAVFSNVEITQGIASEGDRERVLESTLETVAVASTDRRVVYHSRDQLSLPRWAPDGEQLYFHREGRAFRVNVGGGEPQLIDKAPESGGREANSKPPVSDEYDNQFASASPDGQLIAFLSYPKVKDTGDVMLRVIPAEGGDVRMLAKFNGGDPDQASPPAWSQDGSRIAFVSHQFALAPIVKSILEIPPGEPTKIPLWEKGAPGFEDRKDEPERAESYWVKNIHHPSITAFLPPKDKATGTAVVVCPGGGHKELVYKAEGVEAAESLNQLGVAAFVLKYRLGREPDSPYSVDEHPRQDARRAMRLVRSHAAGWGIDPKRIGMMGFSAGGEVVSMVAYDSGKGDPDAADPVERANAKPDFQIMVYPGPLGIPDKIPDDAPPAFLLVANDDRGASRVISGLFQRYRQAGRPVEAHIFARGGHAFNMGDRSKLKTISKWPERLADWLSDNDYLKPASGTPE